MVWWSQCATGKRKEVEEEKNTANEGFTLTERENELAKKQNRKTMLHYFSSRYSLALSLSQTHTHTDLLCYYDRDGPNESKFNKRL